MATESIDPVPVALVHGVGSSFVHTWRKPGWVDVLEADGRTVLPFDLPGHGSAAEADLSAGFSGAVTAFLDVVDTGGRVDAVGMSAGGATVLAAVAARPDLFRRVAVLAVGDGVLGGGSATLAPDGLRTAAAAELADALGGETEPADNTPRLFWRMARSAGNDRRRVADFLRYVAPVVDADALAHVTCPVLVALGDRDFAGPATGLVAALPHARLAELRGVDHVGTATSVAAIDVVTSFLGEA